MISYIKKLNWSGYLFMLLLSALGAGSNKNVDSLIGFLIVFSIGAFLSLFVLFAGKKD
jgi:hypothetical protein